MIEFEKATKLWQLWEIALHDLKLCKDDPKYEISMRSWLEKPDNICYVCAAGAVIAQRLLPTAV